MVEYEYTKNAFRDWIWKVIGKGSKLQWGGTADTVIEDWTPNNVRRLVITPDIIIVGRFNHSSQAGASNKISASPLKNPEPIMYSLLNEFGNGKGGTELDNAVQDIKSTMLAIMGVKEGVRVFSNIEDLIIIPFSTKGSEYDFTPEINDVFVEVCSQIPKRRRFRCLTVYTGPEFTNIMDVVKEGNLLSRDELQESSLFQQIHWQGEDNQEKEVTDGAKEDYHLYYSLRPRYYKLDEQGGYLYNYFEKDKQDYIDLVHLGNVEEVEEEIEEVEEVEETLEVSGWLKELEAWMVADDKLGDFMEEVIGCWHPYDKKKDEDIQRLLTVDLDDAWYGCAFISCISKYYTEKVVLLLELYNFLPQRLFLVEALNNVLENSEVKKIVNNMEIYNFYLEDKDSFKIANYPQVLRYLVQGGSISRFDSDLLSCDGGLYTLSGFTKGFENFEPVLRVVVRHYNVLISLFKEYRKVSEKYDLSHTFLELNNNYINKNKNK